MTVRIERGEGCRDLFDARWDELVRRQAVPNPTLTSPWLSRLLEWESGIPLAIVVERGQDLVAAGAFGIYRPARRLGPTLARWLGDDRQWFSPDLLVDPATPAAGVVLTDALLGAVDGLHLAAAARGPAAGAISSSIPWHSSVHGAEGWVVALPPPRLGLTTQRFERDRRRAGRRGAEVTTRVWTTPEDVAPALESLFELHAARWRMRGGEIARFSTTEYHRAWYRGLVRAMAERGEALVTEVLEDGEVVAADLGFITGTGGLGHTTTIRHGATLKEPGHASQLAMVLALMERGATSKDLGPGGGEPGGPKAGLGPERSLPSAMG